MADRWAGGWAGMLAGSWQAAGRQVGRQVDRQVAGMSARQVHFLTVGSREIPFLGESTALLTLYNFAGMNG